MTQVSLTFPRKTSPDLVCTVASKVRGWYIVSHLVIDGRSLTWKQDNFHTSGAESLASFIEGLQIGVDLDYRVVVGEQS
jgi:hypothetical protein